jgi:hypothetical protein
MKNFKFLCDISALPPTSDVERAGPEMFDVKIVIG